MYDIPRRQNEGKVGSIYDFVSSNEDNIFRILLFTCCATPYRLAFNKDTIAWVYVDSFIDLCFFIDLIINFFSAYYDDEFMLIDDKKVLLNQIYYYRLLLWVIFPHGF